MDATRGFLNEELDEEIYVRQPEGFVNKSKPNHVLRLKKPMCGLNQTPRAPNMKFNETMLSMGMTRCPWESCIYSRRSGKDITILGFYLDDILIVGSDEQKIIELKQNIQMKFKVKDLGPAQKYLGMGIDQSELDIVLRLNDYWKKVLGTRHS